ncbi:MAG: hypothetical protein L0Z53_06815 [Acidobacteriales bacterium]|nr:hypothetical protein [Terriglobales bacterium]
MNVFPKLTPLLAQVKKGTPGGPERMQWGGEGVFWDVILTRPVGMIASDSGFLGDESEAVERQATLGIKRTYVTRQVDGLALSGTASREAAFVPLARKLMQEAVDASQLGQQEVLHGDGRALKALITVVTSTTVVDVQSPYGISGGGQGGLLLDQGMKIAVLDTSGSDAVLGRATLLSVVNAGDTATLTFDTAIAGMAATDKIVAATDSDTSFNAYPNGLTNIVNRGAAYNSFEGISAATFPRWDATRFVAGTDTDDASQPNEMDVWKLATVLAGKSGKDAKLHPNEFLMLTTPGVERRLAESFLGERRWDADANVTLKGGFRAIQIMGLRLISDYWCPVGTLYMVHLPSLSWVDRQDWIKVSYEGAGPWRWIVGRDAYEFSLGSYWNFGALQRNSHGIITGYTDPDRFTHVQ